MASQSKQPKPRCRKRRVVSVVLFLALAFCAAAGVVLWRCRIAVATRVVRAMLDKQGLSDVAFRLSSLSSGRVVVEEVRVGTPEQVLAVDNVDVRFSYPEVLRRQVERVHVRGVRTRLIVADGKVVSPLYERFKPLLAAQVARGKTRPPAVAAPMFSLGAGALQDVRVAVVSAGSEPLTVLQLSAGTLSESADQYRVWGSLRAENLLQLKIDGTVQPATGSISVFPDLKFPSVENLFAVARLVVPAQMARFEAVPTNCSLTVRGALVLGSWTNMGPFEVSAELGRGSAFAVPSNKAFVRFQSVRIEASGTPRDAQCRVSAGVSGLKFGPQVEASQEEGRMLSLRGSARFRQTATNQWVTATLDSDLPGRSIARLLPRVLPLVPVFFSDGGTLHTEFEVTRPLQGAWLGQVKFAAEALRSSAPLTAGRVGAGAVRVAGTVAIVDSKPGVVQTGVTLADGYFFRRNLTVRGGLESALTAYPPYATASGMFKGHVSESVALPQRNLSFKDGTVPFEGETVVTGLASNPVWQISLRVPEFGLLSTQQTVCVQATAGAAASLRYSATTLALEGDAWLRDVAAQTGPASNRVAEAGVSRMAARFKVPEFNRTLVSNAVVELTLGASNGWARAGSLAVLEELQGQVPLVWSLPKGLSFLPGQSLAWQRLEAQGLKVVPDGFSLTNLDSAVELRFGARVAESKLGVSMQALVPLAAPKQTVIAVTLPDTEIAADDAVAAVVRGKVKDMAFTGRVAADAKIRFLGAQPHVLGRMRVTDGRVRSGKMEVEGLAADVPFESGVFFRTIERPAVSFIRAKAGNIRLDQGRLSFQLTQQELFVDRMEVGWCKGSLSAYSLHLDLKDPKDDFIVYADRIDLGEALMMVLPFKGKMEGVLYGRFPVGFDKGHVKLSNGFLYSLPDQGGKLRLDDSRQMITLLEKAGIKGDVQVPLSKALSDMDFNTFKMELEPRPDGEGTLRIKVVGKSNDKEWPAPVDLNLNLHGPLEELLNIGLNVSRK